MYLAIYNRYSCFSLYLQFKDFSEHYQILLYGCLQTTSELEVDDAIMNLIAVW